MLLAPRRYLALLTVDALKDGDDGRQKVPVKMQPDRWRHLLVGWLEVATANTERSRWEQRWKHLHTTPKFCSSPSLAVQQPLSSLPRADDIDPVGEAEGLEHDEVKWTKLCWQMSSG